MLKVENISTGYGKKQVLYKVSFEVKAGEIVLLTGGNGSGKSTVLKAIYGLLPLWNGSILYQGENLSDLSSSKLLKKGIVYIPQNNNLFENLTIYENLEISGSGYSKNELTKRLEKVWKLPKLYEIRKRTPFKLSGGERKLTSFAMALLHEPNLIMLDEPITGIDAYHKNMILNLIDSLKNTSKVSFLIVEHKSDKTKINSNRTITLELGKIKFNNTLSD
jgi:branched-chain amino acid transport system ATP-binding protein